MMLLAAIFFTCLWFALDFFVLDSDEFALGEDP